MRYCTLALALVAFPVVAQETDHSQHGMENMDHSQHGEPAEEDASADEIGNDPAPAVPTDHAADRIFPVSRMATARDVLMHESRFRTTTLMIDQLEYRAVKGRNGYGWEGELWTGGDLDRLVVASEGEGELGHAPESVEVRAMWRHALDPWFNLELGIRHDFRPDPERSYALVGIEGLAPYWLEAEGQLLVSNKGDIHARFGAEHDMRITQRLVFQPSAEIDFALQEVPELGIGSGIEKIELGGRLRYEFVPEFAPYVGVHWEQKLNGTADFARAADEKPSSFSVVFGIRAWF